MIEHSDRIVIYGMSCVGKTTFAQTITSHNYICFDALFPWHMMETFGLSFSHAMEFVKKKCDFEKFVLDGWHLGDKQGCYLPENTTVYVLIIPYEKIIEQYRVPVDDPEQHRCMFRQWYSIKYPSPTRYFTVGDGYLEISENDFFTLIE